MGTWNPTEFIIDDYNRGDAFSIHVTYSPDGEEDDIVSYSVDNIENIPLTISTSISGVIISATKAQSAALFNQGSISYLKDGVIVNVSKSSDVPVGVNMIAYNSDIRSSITYPIVVRAHSEYDSVFQTYTFILNNNWDADVITLNNLMATKEI